MSKLTFCQLDYAKPALYFVQGMMQDHFFSDYWVLDVRGIWRGLDNDELYARMKTI